MSITKSKIRERNVSCLLQDLKIHNLHIIVKLLYIIFISCSSLHKVTNWENFRHMLVTWNGNDTSHVRFGIRPRRGFFRNEFKRTDTSMWCISVRGWGWGGGGGHGSLHCPTPLLHYGQEKNQLLDFICFCPKRCCHGNKKVYKGECRSNIRTNKTVVLK